jgi:tetratricopeptide (TPR) repeat protein
MAEAAGAFADASAVASRIGDMVGVLLARVNEAHLIALRGNLPKAEEMLDETIRRAQGGEFQDVRSRALHTRSNVAHLRGDYEFAVRIAYSAFHESDSATQRDRILHDIAVAFLELGVYSAAQDAYLVLSTTAQEQYMRWTATINLLEMSSRTGAGILFEGYRRQLMNEQLPPYLTTAYELNVGLGYRRLGEFDKARPYLQRAIALASEHGLNQYLFEAEEALQELQKQSPPHRVQREVPLDLEEVATAIKEMAGAL